MPPVRVWLWEKTTLKAKKIENIGRWVLLHTNSNEGSFHDRKASNNANVGKALSLAGMAVCAAIPTCTSNTCRTKEAGGSAVGSKNINRGPSGWLTDYLGTNAPYSSAEFRRLFGVPLCLFSRIHNDFVAAYPEIFGKLCNARRKDGHPSEMKSLDSSRMLGTGRAYDALDDSARIGEETIRITCHTFCQLSIILYGDQYMNRRPTSEQLERIERAYTITGFSGCVRCVDCMKVHWKNCPKARKGQCHNAKERKLAVISLEPWCDRALYVWHGFAGRPGTNNDITMAYSSPLFNDVLTDSYKFSLPSGYTACSHAEWRFPPYFPLDGIYLSWSTFAEPIHKPCFNKESEYTVRQEAIRKDIERCFGVLQE